VRIPEQDLDSVKTHGTRTLCCAYHTNTYTGPPKTCIRIHIKYTYERLRACSSTNSKMICSFRLFPACRKRRGTLRQKVQLRFTSTKMTLVLCIPDQHFYTFTLLPHVHCTCVYVYACTYNICTLVHICVYIDTSLHDLLAHGLYMIPHLLFM